MLKEIELMENMLHGMRLWLPRYQLLACIDLLFVSKTIAMHVRCAVYLVRSVFHAVHVYSLCRIGYVCKHCLIAVHIIV